MNVDWGFLAFLFSAMALFLIFQLHLKVGHLQRQLGLLLKRQGIDPTSGPEVSDHVIALARDPARKIDAIKALREETGVGLAEAKRVVEDIARNSGV